MFNYDHRVCNNFLIYQSRYFSSVFVLSDTEQRVGILWNDQNRKRLTMTKLAARGWSSWQRHDFRLDLRCLSLDHATLHPLFSKDHNLNPPRYAVLKVLAKPINFRRCGLEIFYFVRASPILCRPAADVGSSFAEVLSPYNPFLKLTTEILREILPTNTELLKEIWGLQVDPEFWNP